MSTPTPLGHFIWHDCLTLNLDVAIDFFSTLTSWNVMDQTSSIVGRYPIIQGQNGAIAGMLEMPQFLQDSGVPPYWTGYVHTDLTLAASEIPKLGGQIFTAPTESAMGTSFVFTDSGGAVLAAYEPADSFRLPSSTHQDEIVWQRLYSRDTEKSKVFYRALFDWQINNSEEETKVLRDSAGKTVGDLAGSPSWIESDTWVFFIAVSDVAKAASTITQNGGNIIEDTRIQDRPAVVAKDVQGSVIGFVHCS